jgi:CheY-like chemotaxis protein
VNPKLKTVLFVDDSTDFIELITSLAQQSKANQWNVLSASTTAQALRYLGAHNVDLAVLDLRMPIVDGIQFLQLIHRKHPQMKKALLSSYPDDARRQNATQYGAELVLTKPLDYANFEVLFETLDELLHTQSEEGFRGVLRKIGLEDILQMECLSRHTSLLEVTGNGEHGKIYIQQGKIVHAEFGRASGEQALNRLLGLKGGQFHHATYVEPEARTIEASWEFLLMEAARQKDELADAKDRAAVPAPASPRATAIPASACKEIVVTSDRGEVIFEKGSTDKQGRASIMKLIRNVGAKIGEMLPFGPLERVELPGENERNVVRLTDQGTVFVCGESTK